MANKKSSDSSTEKQPDIRIIRDDDLVQIYDMGDLRTTIDKKSGLTWFNWMRNRYLEPREISFVINFPPSIGHDSALEKGLED